MRLLAQAKRHPHVQIKCMHLSCRPDKVHHNHVTDCSTTRCASVVLGSPEYCEQQELSGWVLHSLVLVTTVRQYKSCMSH